jgi:hypothetical protein
LQFYWNLHVDKKSLNLPLNKLNHGSWSLHKKFHTVKSHRIKLKKNKNLPFSIEKTRKTRPTKLKNQFKTTSWPYHHCSHPRTTLKLPNSSQLRATSVRPSFLGQPFIPNDLISSWPSPSQLAPFSCSNTK